VLRRNIGSVLSAVGSPFGWLGDQTVQGTKDLAGHAQTAWGASEAAGNSILDAVAELTSRVPQNRHGARPSRTAELMYAQQAGQPVPPSTGDRIRGIPGAIAGGVGGAAGAVAGGVGAFGDALNAINDRYEDVRGVRPSAHAERIAADRVRPGFNFDDLAGLQTPQSAAPASAQVPPGQQPGRAAQATPQHGFDLSTIADAMLRPDVNGALTVKPDGSITFKSETNRPDQAPGGSANVTQPVGQGFNAFTPPTSFDDPGGATTGKTVPPPAEDPVGSYLSMLDELGSDEARINFGLEQGIISDAVATSLGSGASINNEDLFTWDGGQIRTLAEVTPGGDPPGGDPPGGDPPGGDPPGGDPPGGDPPGGDPPGGDPPGGDPPGGDPPGGDPAGVVFTDDGGNPITFTAAQANTITKAVESRTKIIDNMVAQGLIDIQSAQDLYDTARNQIFSSFIREQGIINRQFNADLKAAGIQRDTDRAEMLQNLQRAGIDPGLISAELAEIDAIYGEGSSAQRDYLDNITRIGAMSDVERQLLGMYQFGGARQDLRSEGRALGAQAELGGVDRLEALGLQSDQAAQLAPFFGTDQSTLLAGMLSGVDVGGTLEQRRGAEAARDFARQERLAGQQFTAGQSALGRQFTAGQSALGRQFTADQSALGRFADQQITPYQQAQLDLSQSRYDLDADKFTYGKEQDLFDALTAASTPSAAEIRQQTASDYKSALQAWNAAQAIAGRTGSPAPNPVDVLSDVQIDALAQYDVGLSDLTRQDDNIGTLAAATGIPEGVIRGAMKTGTSSQLLANAYRDMTSVLVNYVTPEGFVVENVPVSQVAQFTEAEIQQQEAAEGRVPEPTPLDLYGFYAGMSDTGIDPRLAEAIRDLIMGAGQDPSSGILEIAGLGG